MGCFSNFCEPIKSYPINCNRFIVMRRIFASTLLASIFLLFVGLPGSLAEWSISRISERYAPAVVKITTMDDTGRIVGSGSGFFVNSSGDVATNYHVLEHASKAVVKTVKGDQGEILEIARADPGVDLLIAGTSFRNTLPVTLGDSDGVIVGESVLIMGNSPGWEGTLSSGTISRIRKADNLSLLQVTAPILPGGSGGPVFSITGRVIGIATAFLDVAQFAVPVNYLKTLKAESSPLEGLRGSAVKLEAFLVDNTLVDVLVTGSHDVPVSRGMPSSSGDGHRPLTICFKNGKKVLCDWVWKEGGTLFLVFQGKHFAVGYDLNLIDVKRSLFR
jgi:hypothetical protein